MTLRVTFSGDQMGPKFQFGMKRHSERVGRAAAKTMLQVGQEILKRGRAQMASAGRFGSSRWQQGLKAKTQANPAGVGILETSISHDQKAKFWIFEKGGVIKGRPLLWIPLSFAKDAQGIRAKNFPGGLFRVDRKSGGAPLLLSIQDQRPKYFGKESVRIPKKFRIREIAREVARGIGGIYRKIKASEKGR